MRGCCSKAVGVQFLIIKKLTTGSGFIVPLLQFLAKGLMNIALSVRVVFMLNGRCVK